MHAELKAVYDHVRFVYPLVDPDRAVDAAFGRAADQMHRMPLVNRSYWLLGLVRAWIDETSETGWQEKCGAEVTRALGSTVNQLQDWHLWIEGGLLIELIERLSTTDQEILRLITGDTAFDAHALSLVTG
ncbi:MAG: hypothetical protein JWR83_438, partial [Aeromicrobium sp.]|nr:hypothetical protein [Aeromicrobium sp.]